LGESLPTALSFHALQQEGVGAFSIITKGDFYIITDNIHTPIGNGAGSGCPGITNQPGSEVW
jgi:hypothetical protein